LTTDGPGTLTLGSANANLFTGTVTINGGTVKLNGASALGANNNGVTINAGTLDLNGISTTAAEVGAFNGTVAGTVTDSGVAATFTIGNNNTSGYYAGALTGANLALTKAGTGFEVLLGANTYGGATTISGGALQANDGAGLSSNSELVLSGGVLESYGPATFTRALGTSAGQVQFTGASTSGFAAAGGPLTVNIGGAGATLTWNSTANFLSTGKV
jgi:autotransporter-associated beta strand protein